MSGPAGVMAARGSAALPTGPIGLDFGALRDEGIASLQALCGDLWTDYNLHDPGVTVLEQLVYGLTDLAYRTEFDVADYLTGPDGAIDFDGLAMYPPQDVFHGQALTANDYRRLLFDRIPALSEVWVRACGSGRLEILVAVPAALQTPHGRASIEQRVRKCYAANRSLCEDLHAVTVLDEAPYFLDGDIDLCGARAPADILAQILVDCRRAITAGMTVHRLRDVVAEGMPPETVYEGPATLTGYVSVDAAPDRARFVTISAMAGVIQRIEGVRAVRGLAFRDAGGNRLDAIGCDTRTGRYPCLPFPQGAQRGYLRLQAEHSNVAGAHPAAAAGAKHHAIHADAEPAVAKLQFHRQAFRDAGNNDGPPFTVPAGRLRPLAQYWSVQNDFPAVYGIGQYGLPPSADPVRIAQARQLKGYLFPFEQLMANYLQNLQAIPTLFSTRDPGQASYFHQPLANGQIPDIAALMDGPAGAAAGALREQDDYYARKGRVFDYLLALHGDAFPQAALRRFNQYHPDDTERWLLDAKARLLHSLVELSAERGRAGDYRAAPGSSASVAVLERRVAILLGLGNADPQAHPAMPWGGSAADRVGARAPHRAPARERVPPGGHAAGPGGLPPDAFTTDMLRAGSSLANYATVPDGDGPGATLYCGGDDAWSVVGHYATRDAAIQAAHACVAALCVASQAAERPRIVEHVLLWPQGVVPLEPDFFRARMTVVLPDWTVRCADTDFRQFVQETVRDHCPAHVHAHFLWLAPDRMVLFDGLWDSWRRALYALHQDRADASTHRPFNRAAAALVAFLRRPAGAP